MSSTRRHTDPRQQTTPFTACSPSVKECDSCKTVKIAGADLCAVVATAVVAFDPVTAPVAITVASLSAVAGVTIGRPPRMSIKEVECY